MEKCEISTSGKRGENRNNSKNEKKKIKLLNVATLHVHILHVLRHTRKHLHSGTFILRECSLFT